MYTSPMANYDFKKFDEKTAAGREWLAREYRGLRTGRASAAILDGVSVSAYGSLMPLKQVANVSVEDARSLRVQPYDIGTLKDIERAISAANLGIGTVADSSGIRVTFPDLTTERRQELVKMAKGTLEEARTTIRLARDETWKEIQEKERASELTEDDKYQLKDELQRKTDTANEALEKAFESKEKEMTS